MASSIKLPTALTFALLVHLGDAAHHVPSATQYTLVALLPLTMMGPSVEASSHGPMDEGRKLAAACICKTLWKNPFAGVTLNYGCSNPDNDVNGPWCETTSSSCTTVNQGQANGQDFYWARCPSIDSNNAVEWNSKLTCASCTAANGVWCSSAALCMPAMPTASELAGVFSGDALLCPTAASWSSACAGVATSPTGNDPMYEAQSWVYNLIKVQPVWQQGYTGRGITVAINDDGIDLTLPDFGPLSDGTSKFDVAGSCFGYDACVGGGTAYGPNGDAQCASGVERGSAYGSHGTATAAIAVGNSNGFCSQGIAPDAKLAGCPFIASSTVMQTMTGTSASSQANGYANNAAFYNSMTSSEWDRFAMPFALDRVNISSNSWGVDPCSRPSPPPPSSRRQLSGTCPFQSAFANSPCSSVSCPSDWSAETPSASCESAIRSYCDASTRWQSQPSGIDPECHNWWHLTLESCSYSDLSDIDIRMLQYAVTNGRQGRGTVFVFSAGNEYGNGEDLNYEAWLFTRYTIAVGAVGKLGKHAYYSSAGAALLVSAPGGDNEYSKNHVVAQPGGGGATNCKDATVGTSYAAPVVSGVIALMLEANPSLTWRDVQGLLATTSQKTDPTDVSWTTNAAGLHHSRK